MSKLLICAAALAITACVKAEDPHPQTEECASLKEHWPATVGGEKVLVGWVYETVAEVRYPGERRKVRVSCGAIVQADNQ